MDCHDFKKNHLAFVDDTLPGVDMIAMRHHLEDCRSCARHDAAIRKSLDLAHELPMIVPSPDFSHRLRTRLRGVKPHERRSWRYDGPRASAFLAAAMLVVMLGSAVATAFDWTEPAILRHPPVVATTPARTTSPISSPVITVTSVSTGMSAWPAVLMADEAPMHFANAEFQLANWRSGR